MKSIKKNMKSIKKNMKSPKKIKKSKKKSKKINPKIKNKYTEEELAKSMSILNISTPQQQQNLIPSSYYDYLPSSSTLLQGALSISGIPFVSNIAKNLLVQKGLNNLLLLKGKDGISRRRRRLLRLLKK